VHLSHQGHTLIRSWSWYRCRQKGLQRAGATIRPYRPSGRQRQPQPAWLWWGVFDTELRCRWRRSWPPSEHAFFSERPMSDRAMFYLWPGPPGCGAELASGKIPSNVPTKNQDVSKRSRTATDA